MEQVDALLHLDREPQSCEVCGAELTWIECWKCLGNGEFDLYEDDPIYYEPGEVETCDECGGDGGWLGCEMKHSADCASEKSP